MQKEYNKEKFSHLRVEGDCTVSTQCWVVVSPKLNAILLHFLHHFKDHILPFNVQFQHKPQEFNTHFRNLENTNLTLPHEFKKNSGKSISVLLFRSVK
jgi:hypothetical protein